VLFEVIFSASSGLIFLLSGKLFVKLLLTGKSNSTVIGKLQKAAVNANHASRMTIQSIVIKVKR
jgi:hypothetical protein